MSGRLLVLNEHGAYVPSDGNATSDGRAGIELAHVSETEKILSLAANGGGSGTGMSYYSVAARCGRKARLDTERRAMYRNTDAPLPATKNHFVIGSVYHKLHELARANNNLPLIDLNERWQNPNVAEGVRLYKGWLRTWGVDFWGRCLGVEVKIIDTQTFPCVCGPHSGDDPTYDCPGDGETIPVTAALDMIVEMDDAACERAKRRGLELSPGRYIIDWKTSDGPGNGVGYAEGLQALWYCAAWNQQNPHQQVSGIVFDVVNKRARRKDRSVLAEDFQAHYVPCGLEDVQALAGLVQQGHENVTANRPNRAECTDWQGNVCAFRMSGECDARD